VGLETRTETIQKSAGDTEMAKMFVMGKVTHGGKIFQNTDVSVGDGQDDDIDERSAKRLEAMGYLVKSGSDAAKARKAEIGQAQASAAETAQGLADDPLAGAHTMMTTGSSAPGADAQSANSGAQADSPDGGDAGRRGGGNQGDISTRGKGGR
jgi:hypothetical protein